jgi:hypothetical protein
MQTQIAAEDRSSSNRLGLKNEAEGLEALHHGWQQQVAAWHLAHKAAAQNAGSILSRIDALIAKLEAL